MLKNIEILIFYIFAILMVFIYWNWDSKSPYAQYDICFKCDWPGATGRYTDFTPVKCSDPKIVLGEAIGGTDYGKISYRDVDNDGFPEVIIEPSWRCYLSFECEGERIIFKTKLGDPPVFEEISRELVHSDNEHYD